MFGRGCNSGIHCRHMDCPHGSVIGARSGREHCLHCKRRTRSLASSEASTAERNGSFDGGDEIFGSWEAIGVEVEEMVVGGGTSLWYSDMNDILSRRGRWTAWCI
jgi:hypothetical protein